MKSRFIFAILGVIVAITMAACGKETVESYANKYEAFLEGGESLFFHDYREDNLFEEFIEIDNGYTLDELLQAVVTYYELEKTPTVEYAYMDCGNDGVEELAVRFCGTERYSKGDDSTIVFVVKEKGDKLEMCFAYETWARSDSTLNYCGYYTSAGSGGASIHGWDVGYIDGTGQYIFVQAGEEESNINQLFLDDELGKVPEIAETKQYEGEISVVTTYMDRVYEDRGEYDWYYYKDRYYTFYVDGADEKISDIYAAGVYKEIFDEAGIKTYRPEEIDALILEKEESLGITEEIRQGKLLEWN